MSRQSVIVAEPASQSFAASRQSAVVSGQSVGLSQQFYREGMASSALDNFVHVPVLYTPAFYVITELLQGFSWDHTMAVHCALLCSRLTACC